VSINFRIAFDFDKTYVVYSVTTRAVN